MSFLHKLLQLWLPVSGSLGRFFCFSVRFKTLLLLEIILFLYRFFTQSPSLPANLVFDWTKLNTFAVKQLLQLLPEPL